MSKANIRLGVPQKGYGVNKNIPGDILAESIRPIDYFRVKAATTWLLFKKVDNRDLFRFQSPSLPRVDLLHFFNTVAFTNTPWIVTFESLLPYFNSSDSDQERCLDQLLGESCKGIIAMSNHAKVNFQWKLNQLGKQTLWDNFAEKITVLYPPEKLRPTMQKYDRINFIFVAREFYKKGGHVVLRALDWLKYECGFDNWSAVLIGDLDSQPDHTVTSFEKLHGETCELLERLSENTEHHGKMSHTAVLSAMQRSHFLLHPTLQDTYGYVITEAMSCGCVPISCRIRAIAEIVDHQSSGFLLDVQTDENGNPKDFISSAMWQEVEAQLKDVLSGLFAADVFQEYQSLKAQARSQIELFHNPELHRAQLMKLYRDALS